MLQQWCDGTKRVAAFPRRMGGQRHRFFHPKGVGYGEDLWAFTRDEVAGMDRQFLETRIFQEVDNYAAPVRDKLDALGAHALSSEERAAWVRFLISLQMRQPNLVGIARASGHATLIDKLQLSDTEKAELKAFDLDGSLLAWLEARAPGLAENFGLSLYPEILTDSVRNFQIAGFAWVVLDLGGLTNDLLVGDAPSLLRGQIDEPDFVWALPLSPTKAFFACSSAETRDRLARVERRHVIARLNAQTLYQVRDRVFARGLGQQKFIAKQWALWSAADAA